MLRKPPGSAAPTNTASLSAQQKSPQCGLSSPPTPSQRLLLQCSRRWRGTTAGMLHQADSTSGRARSQDPGRLPVARLLSLVPFLPPAGSPSILSGLGTKFSHSKFKNGAFLVQNNKQPPGPALDLPPSDASFAPVPTTRFLRVHGRGPRPPRSTLPPALQGATACCVQTAPHKHSSP